MTSSYATDVFPSGLSVLCISLILDHKMAKETLYSVLKSEFEMKQELFNLVQPLLLQYCQVSTNHQSTPIIGKTELIDRYAKICCCSFASVLAYLRILWS